MNDLGFTEPTPVQLAAIPAALAGRDVLASASTGSGKSAAFGLPLLEALIDLPRGKTRALILAPTRELAAQITEHLRPRLPNTRTCSVAAVYGGVGFGNQQVGAFRRGTDIIVATPGTAARSSDAKDRESLDGVTTLVLDEADRMLDMGFSARRASRAASALPAAREDASSSRPRFRKRDRERWSNELLKNRRSRVDLAPASRTPARRHHADDLHDRSAAARTTCFIELLKDNNIFSAIAFTRTKVARESARGDLPHEERDCGRTHSRRSFASAAHARARRLQARKISRARRDRHRGPRYRHRRTRTRRSTTTFRWSPKTTSTVSAAPRARKATGDAITFVAPDEEKYFAQIERALGRRLDRSKNPALPAPSVVAPVAAVAQAQRRPQRRRTG